MARLDAAQREQIVLAHLIAAYRISRNRPYRSWGLHEDELEQAAAIGLVLASQTYDPAEGPGVPFGAYAQAYVERSIWEAIAENLVGSDDLPLTRDVPAPEDNAHTLRMVNEVQSALESLPQTERYVLSKRHGLDGQDPMGLLALADTSGCSVRTINRTLANARRLFSEELRSRGWDIFKVCQAYEIGRKLA